jgi:tryptophanyl-tRNA synthetase
MKAKTAPQPLPSEIAGLKQRPEADNLVGIYAALAGSSKEEVLRQFGGAQFSTFKPTLAELAVEKLAPIASEMRRLTDNPGHIDGILTDGANRARVIAAPTMKDVRAIVGLISGR